MLQLLRDVINPAVQARHENKQLVFCETQNEAKLKRIEFRLTQYITEQSGQLKNAVIISSDVAQSDQIELTKFSHFLAADCPDINRKCDYIIFHHKDDILRVILFEMKSSAAGAGGRCPAQFAVSEVFADYLIQLAKVYGQLNQKTSTGLKTKVFKVAFYPKQPVLHSLPLGKKINSMQQAKKITDNGVMVFAVNTNNATAKVDWRDFMQAIDGSSD